MKYLKKYSLFENTSNEFNVIDIRKSEVRKDLVSIKIDDTNIGYDFIINKNNGLSQVIYDFEPDSFIISIGINEDGVLKDSKLNTWLLSLNENSVNISISINDNNLLVEKFENVGLLKKGILKVSYNNQIISFLIKEGDLDNEDKVSFLTNEDKLIANNIGISLDQETIDKLLELYY